MDDVSCTEKMKRFGLILFIFFVSLEKLSHGKIIEGVLSTTGEKWHFLTRFCFLSVSGKIEFEIEYPVSYAPQNILLYYDSPDQWPAVYNTNKNCQQKVATLRPENNQIISLTERYTYSGCGVVNDSTTQFVAMYRCSAGREFRSSRQRWWFITLSNCDSTKGLQMKYKFWLTNGDNIFFKHFSADEFYILQVDIGFLIAFLILLVLSVLVAILLKTRQLFHTTYKMYMVSLALQVVYLFLMCVTLGKYANDGIENRGMINFARIFETISILVFILMLILMGKGYTITRGRLSQGSTVKIAVFMTLYSIVYAVLFIYEAVFFDPGEVLYLFESPPGYGLMTLRLIAWVWFCYAIFFTLKHYPEKSRFYYPFFILYTLWFWAGPIMILVSMFVMGEWVREKVVNAVILAMNFVAYLIFLILTRPGAANKNFPYHVRTSQIGIMTNSGQSQAGMPMTASKQSESFSSHPYAPSAPSTDFMTSGNTPDFNELFCVQKEKSPQNTEQQNGNTVPIDNYPHQYPNGTNPFIVSQNR